MTTLNEEERTFTLTLAELKMYEDAVFHHGQYIWAAAGVAEFDRAVAEGKNPRYIGGHVADYEESKAIEHKRERDKILNAAPDVVKQLFNATHPTSQ